MADLPDGMLPQALSAGGRAAEVAESGTQGCEALPLPGGVGDSPVLGELVPRPAEKPSKLTTEGLKRVARADSKIRRRSEKIVSVGLGAYKYDLSEPKPDNVSAEDWRIMRAANENMKSQPGWFTAALRIREGIMKADSVKPPAPTINAQLVQVNVVQTSDMPVRRLKDG